LKRRFFLAAATWAVLAAVAPAGARAAEPAALEICVLPYLSPKGLADTYGPLAAFMERQLGRPVRIVTTRDYGELIQRTARKEFPILVTAAHFARMAEVDTGYIPVLRPLTNYYEVVVVAKDSPLRAVGELRGKTVTVPDMTAQTTLMGRLLLRKHGLDPDRDVNLVVAGSHRNAVEAMLAGRAQAAIVSSGGFRHQPEEVKTRARVVAPLGDEAVGRKEAIPVIYAISPKVPAAEAARYAALIQKFANEDAEGKEWINKLSYQGLRPPTADEMTAIDPHVRELRGLLNRF
jgi:ABC-type phosphate/phosphonate transport system substrate-binding protein